MIQKINCVNLYSNRLNSQNCRKTAQAKSNNAAKSKVSFGSCYYPTPYTSNEEYQKMLGEYEQSRMLHGWGYGRTNYISLGEFVEQRRRAAENSCGGYSSYIGSDAHKKDVATEKAKEYIKDEKYLLALKEKLKIAEICRKESETKNTFMLEESIRGLYTRLNNNEKKVAKSEIAQYNWDMAKYIDQDIAKNPSLYYSDSIFE